MADRSTSCPGDVLTPDAGDRPLEAAVAPPEKPRSGRWERTVLLLSGGSHMGKSFFAKTVLASEYGAIYRQIDNVYTVAVNDANMLDLTGLTGSEEENKRQAEKDARRRARDRKWPDAKVKAMFFDSYRKQIREACHEGLVKGVPVVLEGGSLRNKEEVKITARCALQIYGPRGRLVRITVESPYERWLQNRVGRMAKSGVASTALSKLSLETYNAEVQAATPKPYPHVVDHKVSDVQRLRELMETLKRT